MDWFPKVAELIQFIEQRAQTLGVVTTDEINGPEGRDNRLIRRSPDSCRVCHTASVSSVNGTLKCPLCAGAHRIFNCGRFPAKSTYQWREEIRRLRLCFVYLETHKVINCTSRNRCYTCRGKHIILLHACCDLNHSVSDSVVENRSDEADKPTG
ncbi:hypothetical protein M0802_015167 [Mischocyttarus mexicanus]|nr:hypothetical protein M0802_015167 [Mischocyttarus mexicanus]